MGQSGPIFKIDGPINSISFKFRHLWNALPSTIRNLDDYELFNVTFKRYYVARYFENL